MNDIKARALSSFSLNLNEIEFPHCDFVEADIAANPITAYYPKMCSNMDEFLNENLSKNKYKQAIKMLNNETYGKF